MITKTGVATASRKCEKDKMTTEQIAKVCHDANRSYCQTLGDDSQKSWDDAPSWQRDSAIKGVEFRLANPDAPASAQHESWLRQKETDGWSYGPIKDPAAKLHPCCVPYGELPFEQRLKDALFGAIVGALCGNVEREGKAA